MASIHECQRRNHPTSHARASAPIAGPITNWLANIFTPHLTRRTTADQELIVTRYQSPNLSDFHANLATQNALTGQNVGTFPSRNCCPYLEATA